MAAAPRYGPVTVCSHKGSMSWSMERFLILVTTLALLVNVAAVSINNPLITPDSLAEVAVESRQSKVEARWNNPQEYKPAVVPRRALTIRPRGTPIIHKRATPSIPSPTAQVTTGPGSSPIHCPADNLTVFTESSTSKRYVILCGRDYHSSLGAKELYNVGAKSLNECIDACAKDKTGCTAVGWGYMDDALGYRCFLKSSIGEPHDSAGWMVAVEDPSQPGSTALPARQGLGADAKAGIGIGVVAAVVLLGVGFVAAWYYRQRKSTAQQSLGQTKDLSESSSTIGHGSHRTHSPALPPFQQQSLPQLPAGEYPELPGSPVDVSPVPGSPTHTDDSPSPGVTTYLVRQQQQILNSCRPARSEDDPRVGLSNIETSTSQWGATYTYSPDGTLAPMSAMTGHGSFTVAPWSATMSSPASELPVVRGGPNGYGPEYEMDVAVAVGRREGAAEKFLLSDVKLLKEQLASEKRAD